MVQFGMPCVNGAVHDGPCDAWCAAPDPGPCTGEGPDGPASGDAFARVGWSGNSRGFDCTTRLEAVDFVTDRPPTASRGELGPYDYLRREDPDGVTSTPTFFAMVATWQAAGRSVPGVPDPEWQWLASMGPGRRRRPTHLLPYQHAWYREE